MGSCIMFAGKRYLTRVLDQTSGRPLRQICRAQGTSAAGSGEHGGGSLTVGDRLKTGDIYLHRELGYRGIVLYPFTSKSTYYCETSGKVEEKKTEMYATMLLNDVNTRSHIEKYLTVMMVHHDGCFSNNIDLEGNNSDQSIVRAPLPGFDVVNHLDHDRYSSRSASTTRSKRPISSCFSTKRFSRRTTPSNPGKSRTTSTRRATR